MFSCSSGRRPSCRDGSACAHSCWPRGACARAHYSDFIICGSWMCSRAGRPGGRTASGRSLRVSAVSAERGIFSGPVTSSGVHIKGAGFPSTAEGHNPHPGKKRERLRAGFLRFPLAVRAHLKPIISFWMVSRAFHIQYPPYIYLFLYFEVTITITWGGNLDPQSQRLEELVLKRTWEWSQFV